MGKKRTIILSSHILTEVSAICERVLVISNGVIVADDEPDNLASLSASARTLLVRIAGPSGQVRELLQGLDGVKSAKLLGKKEADSCDFLIENEQDADIRRPLFGVLSKAGYPILMLRPQSDTLEDIFLELTEEGS